MARMSLRRKLAIATWSSPREGNIYGRITLDATRVLRYIAHLRETTGEHVTITHFVGRVVGRALAEAPTLNGRILFGRFVPHVRVSAAFLVAVDGGGNLAKAKVEDLDRKTVAEVARELRELAERLRAGRDAAFNKSMSTVRLLPTWLLRPLLWLTGWLSGALGVALPALGLERFPFGGAIVTSVGMFGLDEGFAPPTPFARVPLYVLVGAIRDTPVVEDGEVVVRPCVTITATLDHRFIDGAQGAVLARVVREAFERPWALDGLDQPPWAPNGEAVVEPPPGG